MKNEPGPPVSAAPRPPDEMTIRAAAQTLGVSVKTVRNLLSEFRAAFEPRRYRPGPRGQKLRLLSGADLDRLRTCLLEWWAARNATRQATLAARLSSPK